MEGDMVKEKKFIEANKLLKDLRGVRDGLIAQGDPFLASVVVPIEGCVERQKEAIIRCKDCKWFDTEKDENNAVQRGDKDGRCVQNKDVVNLFRKQSDFCSYGEDRSDS